MSAYLALARYYGRKSKVQLVVPACVIACVVALPWSLHVTLWQVNAAMAAFAVGTIASAHLLGQPEIFERCLPVGIRHRRTLNWLVSALLMLTGSLPGLFLYCSSWNHVLDLIGLQLTVLILGCAVVLRTVLALTGRMPLMLLVLIMVVFAGALLPTIYLWPPDVRVSFKFLLLCLGIGLLIEGLLFILRGDRELGASWLDLLRNSRTTAEPKVGVPSSAAVIGPLSQQVPVCAAWYAQGWILALGLANQVGYLGWSAVMSFLIFHMGAASLGIMVLPLAWGGREMIMSVTRSLSLNGLIDRRLAFTVTIAPLLLMLLASACGATWLWKPSFTRPIETTISLPASQDEQGYGQVVILDLSCSPLRPVRLPDGTVMSLHEYGQRLQHHHLAPTPWFIATQLALVTARDEGFMPDPHLLLMARFGAASTRPILMQIQQARQTRLFLYMGFLMAALMFSFAIRRTGGPRPYQGRLRYFLYWEHVLPLILVAAMLLTVVPSIVSVSTQFPVQLLQDLAYPPVALSWSERITVLLVSHAYAAGALLLVSFLVCSAVAIQRMRYLELDPKLSGDLLQRMKDLSRT